MLTPLERTAMETKYNFTFEFSEAQLQEEFEFRFDYATDSEYEDEDDSFVDVYDRRLEDGRVLLPDPEKQNSGSPAADDNEALYRPLYAELEPDDPGGAKAADGVVQADADVNATVGEAAQAD